MSSTQIATSLISTQSINMNVHNNAMQAAVQISHNGAALFSQGRTQDAMTCFRFVLAMLKSGIRNCNGVSMCPSIPHDLSVPSMCKGMVSFQADGLKLEPVSLNVSLLARSDERSMIVASAVAVYNLAVAHHAASLQAQEYGQSEDAHFYMTSAMKLYTLVQSLQQQADSHHPVSSQQQQQRESSFRLESMLRIAILHNAGVLLCKMNEQSEARAVFEHLFHVVFSLGITPDDFEGFASFDLSAVMARVFLEMNVLRESHTAPCA